MKYSRSDENAPSRTQRKKESTARQTLGVELADLPRDVLARISLPPGLFDAIVEAQRITDHEGKRRQMQYVGRLMRELDDEAVARVRAEHAHALAPSREEARRLQSLERWRAALLDDETAIAGWIETHPATDVQSLRALIRQARKERAEQKPPHAFRALFQRLKDDDQDDDASDRG